MYAESIEINLEVKNTTGDLSHQINNRSELIIKSSLSAGDQSQQYGLIYIPLNPIFPIKVTNIKTYSAEQILSSIGGIMNIISTASLIISSLFLYPKLTRYISDHLISSNELSQETEQ